MRKIWTNSLLQLNSLYTTIQNCPRNNSVSSYDNMPTESVNQGYFGEQENTILLNIS